MNIKLTDKNKNEDSTLWTNLKLGNEKSFSKIFEKYYSHLVRYGNSFSHYNDKVEDCVQDVFADVWVYRESLNHPINVRAYLLSSLRKRIARTLERDRVFNKSASVHSIEFLPEFSIEHESIADEATAVKVLKLNILLNSLPARQKEVLYLKYHHGLDIDEIADTLEVNYQSVSNLLYRAVLNLRKEWN